MKAVWAAEDEIRADAETEANYMSYIDELREERAEGREEGREEGRIEICVKLSEEDFLALVNEAISLDPD